MDARALSSKISVAPQITADDVAKAKAAGFRAIICNRPDGEGADQPAFAEIAAAAKKAGLETRYLPIVSGKVSGSEFAN